MRERRKKLKLTRKKVLTESEIRREIKLKKRQLKKLTEGKSNDMDNHIIHFAKLFGLKYVLGNYPAIHGRIIEKNGGAIKESFDIYLKLNNVEYRYTSWKKGENVIDIML